MLPGNMKGGNDMARMSATPIGALFDLMKRQGGISYKVLASCILSDKPLFGGVSPVSRADDRSWISRYIVHAPVETLKYEYFADYAKGAMRVIARLKASKRYAFTNREVFELVAGPEGDGVARALADCGQDVALYRNMLERLQQTEGFAEVERAEIAMVLMLAAACSVDVHAAVEYALDFSRGIHGSGVATPLITPDALVAKAQPGKDGLQQDVTLGLLKMVDGYVVGSPYWLDCEREGGTVVGALSVEPGAINDVGSDVSSEHLRIFRAEDGQWYAEGMGSKNGTVLISGADGSRQVVEPPRAERDGWEAVPVALHPGDELVLGSDTHFAVIVGMA